MKDIKVDIVILGGGIAGLWLLARLKALGFNTLLLEANALGDGQTIRSQGIIHGGTKYALNQCLTPLAQAIGEMPSRWRACLQGTGEVDLRRARVLAEQQIMWMPGRLVGKLVGFLTSHAMRSRVVKLSSQQYPLAFQKGHFKGEVYALNEPVLDVASVLEALAKAHQASIRRITWPHGIQFHQTDTNNIDAIEVLGQERLKICAQRYIFAAGSGNEALLQSLSGNKPAMQRRPLQQLLLKGMPYHFYAHCVDIQFKPRLTITSHTAADGDIVWYLGGEIAVQGVGQSPEQVFEQGCQALNELLPDIETRGLKWRTVWVDRAEPLQANGGLPEQPAALLDGNKIITWPVKLAFAPLLAEQVVGLLAAIQPRSQSLALPDSWRSPDVAMPPWLEEGPWN